MNDRKPRADAKLKTLPPERQADIFARLELPKKEGGGYESTLKWLKDDGFETSLGALSLFYSWYGLQQQVARNESTVDSLLAEFKKANPEATTDKVQQVGQAFFSALALEQQDPKAWFLTQQLGLKREQLELDRNKFEWDAAAAALAKAAELKAISTSKLTDAEKIDAARRALFGELPEEAQAAGSKEAAP